MPRVSVVIPTYNRAYLLRKAIESVLHQTFTDFELIVVDDGSTDNTKEVIGSIADPRIKYLTQPNKGVAAASNTGIRAAAGEFVAFLHSDDLFLPEKLAAQMAMVDNDPSIGLVYSLFYSSRIGGPKKLQGRCYPPGSRELPEGPKMYLPTTLIQRSWLEQVGGFDEGLAVSEDSELIWRLCIAGCRMAGVPKPLLIRGKPETTLSRDFYHHIENMIAFVNKIFSDPRMPPELLYLRNSVSAKYIVLTSASAYLAAKPEAGRDLLERAIIMDPTLANQNIDQLVSQFVHFVIGHGPEDSEATLRLAMQYLPGGKSFMGKFSRQSWHKFYMDRAFEAYQFGQPLRCRKYALRALVNNPPAALRNRGLLSILVRTWIGKSVFKQSGIDIANDKEPS